MNQRFSVRDLSAFRADLPWNERLDLIRKTFASAPLLALADADHTTNWRKAFDHDVELMGRLLRDVLKADQAVPGRPGPRPALDVNRAQPVVDRWMGKDPTDRPYATQPFAEALKLLIGDERSLMSAARKAGIHYSVFYRLVTGEREPTVSMMEKVAAAFDKKPSYFLEYRIATVAAAVVFKLANAPEHSIRTYEALYWADPKDRA